MKLSIPLQSKANLGILAILAACISTAALLVYSGYSNRPQDNWLLKYDRAIPLFVEAGEFNRALEHGEESLTEAQKHFGPDHHLCAKAHVRLYEVHVAKGDIAQAIRHLRAAIAIYDTHEDIRLVNIGLLEELGDLHVRSGDLPEAGAVYSILLDEMKRGYFRKTAIARIENKISSLTI